MGTLGRWSGRETRLLRQALRSTVRGFAEDLGVSPRTVSKWEAGGAGREPRPEMQAALDTALARATDQERERFFAATGRPTEAASAVVPGARRLDSRWAEQGLPRMNSGQLRQVSDLVEEASSHDERDLVAYFTGRIETCQTLDGSSGGASALPMTLSVVAALDIIAHRVSVALRLTLLTLAARSAEFTGWLYRDAGATDAATYWYDRATEWAQEAHHPAMQGYVLLRKSQMAYETHDAVRAFTLAEAAELGPYQLPIRVRSEVRQQRALGQAMLGEPLGVVERTLGDANHLLSQAVAYDEGSQLLGNTFTESTLRVRSAACYAEAGRARHAADLFEEVLALGALSRRDRGFFGARRSAALALAGEPDEASRLAIQSVEIATRLRSQRTLRLVAEVIEMLEPWRDRPAVRDLREAMGA